MTDTGNKEAHKPKITAREINLPKGGGAIKGMGDSFQPHFFTGTGNYSIPIPAPAGRGLDPDVSLSYSSGSGNGAFGLGFTLSLSRISIDTSKRIPKYDGSDTYLLSGEGQLVKKELQNEVNDPDYIITAYCPRLQSNFSKIEYWFNPVTLESFWKTVSRNNVTNYYGRSANSQISNPSNRGQVFEWLIDETADAKGNRIRYQYKAENDESIPPLIYEEDRSYSANRYIQRIQYGNYQVAPDTEAFAFELVFDYGEYDLSDPAHAYAPKRPWLYRPDPFSFYNSGFEIRTCRLCRNILVFHYFVNEASTPQLVKSLSLNYHVQQRPAGGVLTGPSLLSAVELKGYRPISGTEFQEQHMPPIVLGYSAFNPPMAPEFGRLTMGSGSIPGYLDNTQFLPVDLYGEGLPGFLYSNNETTLYMYPLGDGCYNLPEAPASFPIARNLQGGSAVITDIDGNGELELVVSDPSGSGYYAIDGRNSWENFKSFPSYPADVFNPTIEYVDLNANGKTDLLLAGKENFLVYFSEGKNGYRAGEQVLNENGFPLVKANYNGELVAFANIFGDGLSHRVRIADGVVECWPCLGYGQYGKKVTLGNAPTFDDYFDSKRLFFADIDGSGTADIAYVYTTRVDIFLNQNGNSFAEPITINLPEVYTEIDQVSFADILGNGTSCLVFTKMKPAPVHYYYNFVGETLLQNGLEKKALKPYLLNEIDNNLGAVTQISYCSSTKFYLEDKKSGRPWITKLHFPVQVIEESRLLDKISGACFSTRFKYHDGYYDPSEREFCGFGFVESWDTESFEKYVESPDNPDFPVQRLNRDLYVPPVYTRRWYNTGSFRSNPVFFNSYKKEYFNKDTRAYDFPPSLLNPLIYESGGETLRQACYALKGQPMRTEVYGDDGTFLANIPYTVSESNVEVILRQPVIGENYASFFLQQRESIDYNYERDSEDPAVIQRFTLDTDPDCGLASKTCAVYLPRRVPLYVGTHSVHPQQRELKSVIELNRYINTDSVANGYWRGVACESIQLQLFNLDLAGKLYFSYDAIRLQAFGALKNIVPYQGSLDPIKTEARQFSWTRQYYWSSGGKLCNDFLSLGEISPQGLLHHEENAAFTRENVTTSFGDKLSDDLLEKQGGYFFDAATGYWWNRGLVQVYLDKEGYFLPSITQNCFAATGSPLSSKSAVEYDSPYYLRAVKAVNYLGTITNETVFTIDYTSLQYRQSVDANGNVCQLLFDALDQVIVTTLFGTQEGANTGGMRIYAYGGLPAEYQFQPASVGEVMDNPEKYLQGATSYFFYNLHAWQDDPKDGQRQPVSAISLLRQGFYQSSQSPVPFACQLLITYTDGLGRMICTKQFAGTELLRPLKKKSRTPKMVSGDRWLTTGRVVYNNKGKKCEEYLPYFDDTPYFESQRYLEDDSSISPPSITKYDPLERVIRTDTPKGFFTKVEITAWQTGSYDEDDTILDSDFYNHFINTYPKNPTQREKDERDALDKAILFYNTPTIEVSDNMGYTISTIQSLPDRLLATWRVNDIEGRTIEIGDPRQYESNRTKGTDYFSFRYRYMMNASEPCFSDSPDTGLQLQMVNIYGNLLWSFDARHYCQVISYDEMQRKTELRVAQLNPGDPKIPEKDYNLVERFIYGESQPDAAKHNLRGQVYQVYDLSGLTTNKNYDIQGQLLETVRQIVEAYKDQVNWNEPVVPLGIPYLFRYTFDALKLKLSETTPDGTVTRYRYNQLGLPLATDVDFGGGVIQPIVKQIEYQPDLQRSFIVYGNNILSQYQYENTTQRLLSISSTRPGSKLATSNTNTLVQDIQYTYDPVGNITRVWDFSLETVFSNNKQVDPLFDYTYDALYRLLQANGRQHPSINAGSFRNNKPGGFKQSLFTQLPCSNDSCKLETYKESYIYDDSCNLVKKQHTASSGSFTTDTIPEKNSNRLREISISGLPTVAVSYDPAGNPRNLFINDNVGLTFDCYENLVKAGIIQRPEEPDDTDYYLYDCKNTRARKLSSRLTGNRNLIELTEKIYLGNYEIKQIKQEGKTGNTVVQLERQTLRIMDEQTCVAIIHYWVSDSLNRETSEAGDRSIRFQMGNNLGSVTLEMDEWANMISYEEYFPYGGTALIAGENEKEVELKDYRYSGKECDDSTGLYYYGARYYVSWLGRWLNADPSGTADGLNLYRFVRNNPIKFVDPTGNISVLGAKIAINIASLFLVVAGPILGAAAGGKIGYDAFQHPAAKVAGAIGGGILGAVAGTVLGAVNTVLTPFRWVYETVLHNVRKYAPESNPAGTTYPGILYNATQRTPVLGMNMESGRIGAETMAEQRGIPRSQWNTLVRPFDDPALATLTGPGSNFNGTLLMVGHGDPAGELEIAGYPGAPVRMLRFGDTRPMLPPNLIDTLTANGLDWNQVREIDMSICYGAVLGTDMQTTFTGGLVPPDITMRSSVDSVTPIGNLHQMGVIRDGSSWGREIFHWLTFGLYSPGGIDTAAPAGGRNSSQLSGNGLWRTIRS